MIHIKRLTVGVITAILLLALPMAWSAVADIGLDEAIALSMIVYVVTVLIYGVGTAVRTFFGAE